MGQRLTKTRWIEAGLQTLIDQGPSALAAEPMARGLGTTKGSFYWHFKDVPAFQHAIVTDWQSRALTMLSDAIDASGASEQRLRTFGRALLADTQDQAIRAWAQSNADVARALQEVDTQRLAYLGALLRNLGVTNNGFATALLGAIVGLPQLSTATTPPQEAFDTMIDLVLALQ